MGTVKQINIKNQAWYFYNDIISLEKFGSSLLKSDKKYNTGYITIKKLGDCKNIYSVNLCIYILPMQTDILKK